GAVDAGVVTGGVRRADRAGAPLREPHRELLALAGHVHALRGPPLGFLGLVAVEVQGGAIEDRRGSQVGAVHPQAGIRDGPVAPEPLDPGTARVGRHDHPVLMSDGGTGAGEARRHGGRIGGTEAQRHQPEVVRTLIGDAFGGRLEPLQEVDDRAAVAAMVGQEHAAPPGRHASETESGAVLSGLRRGPPTGRQVEARHIEALRCLEVAGVHIGVGEPSRRRHQDEATSRAAAWAASTTRSITASSWARPGKMTSYGPGAIATPRRKRAWKNAAYRAVSVVRAES